MEKSPLAVQAAKIYGNLYSLRYFAKGFYSMPVFKTLQRRKLSLIIPFPVHSASGGIRTLFKSASHKTTYTFNSRSMAS
jgi:hypothetical protein